jgi:hypothetical protein
VGQKARYAAYLERRNRMSDTNGTALAVAPAQAQPVAPWEDGMKPISYEMAMMLDGDTFRRRLERISAFTMGCESQVRHYKGWVTETIRTYRGDIRALKDKWKECPVVPGMASWKDAFTRTDKKGNVVLGKLFPFSYAYYCQVVRGGRKKTPKALPKPAEKPKADVTVDAAPVSTFQVPPDVDGWLSFFSALTQEQRQAAYEAISKLMEGPRGDDPDHAARYGVALDCAEDDAVGYGAFRPAVAVGDGNGNGCEPQQEDVSDKAAVLAQEAHGTDSLEVTEAADAGVKPAMPGHRGGAKHPPVAIVMEDGRCGHVVAGMGERTKRTMYGVRLENGGRAEARKRLYATPANLAGLCLVPKAWLVDGRLPHDEVPEFLKGQVPAQESGGGEY